MSNRVVVVGSANTDMVVRCPRIPAPGETVIGGEFISVPGGKGANQAVAAARLGAEVTLIARIGTDMFGDQAIEGYRAEGINVDSIVRDVSAPSGVALIIVDEKNGENSIAVAPGANSRLTPENIGAAEALIAKADVMLLQLEVPLETVAAAVRIARRQDVLVILNPAPAPTLDLPQGLLESVDVLTPNEFEARRVTGMNSNATHEAVAAALLERGVKTVVMTLGANGALVANAQGMTHVPAFKVNPVDTTAAGDGFNAGLAVALSYDADDLLGATRYANAVGALTTTRMGAQPSLPTAASVEALLTSE
ncbi:MAG: ribokinase [Anaerolineae bacterium]|nr:ribokinase [Anaerolineae bacterium]